MLVAIAIYFQPDMNNMFRLTKFVLRFSTNNVSTIRSNQCFITSTLILTYLEREGLCHVLGANSELTSLLICGVVHIHVHVRGKWHRMECGYTGFG